MHDIIKEIRLDNGHIIRFSDHTRRYYGDYHLVRVEVSCEFPVLQKYFKDEASFNEAKNVIGEIVVYRRFMEKMGIPSTAIVEVCNRLIGDFESHSLVYFASPEFAPRFVSTAYAKQQKKVIR